MSHPGAKLVTVLAARAATSGDVTKYILVVVGVLIAAALVLGAAAVYLRRRALGGGDGSGGSIMGEIDAMLERGDITPEEHRAMRRRIAERVSRQMDERRAARAGGAKGADAVALRAAAEFEAGRGGGAGGGAGGSANAGRGRGGGSGGGGGGEVPPGYDPPGRG